MNNADDNASKRLSRSEAKELSPKQEQFCREYIIDLNATQAAIRCGYSAKTANRAGSRLLSNDDIASRIKELSGERAERLEIKADDILKALMRVLNVDIADALDDDGFLKPLKDIPADVRKAIAGFDVDEIFAGAGDERTMIGHAKKIKFNDRMRAAELLGRHLKLFNDNEIKVTHSLEDALFLSRKKEGES